VLYNKSCYFKKVFSKKGFQLSCAPFYRGSKEVCTFLKISIDNYLAMWYDNGLGSVGVSWFDFVKSLARIGSDVKSITTKVSNVKSSIVIATHC
jgi:hypothetical protein